MQKFICQICKLPKVEIDIYADEKTSIMVANNPFPRLSVCKDCSDQYLIEDVLCSCSVCLRELPSNYFQHYRTRIKKNGMRLRVNRNCNDCASITKKALNKLKKEILPKYPYPKYGTNCGQCGRVVYEKSEDIPDGVDGANGPWQFDHDHITNTFRGYICKLCNAGTGMIGDQKSFWDKANERKKN